MQRHVVKGPSQGGRSFQMLDVCWMLPEQIGKRASQNFKKTHNSSVKEFLGFCDSLV